MADVDLTPTAKFDVRQAVSRDTKKLTPDEELAEAVSEFYDDPLGYVMFMFPWNTDASIQLVELVEPWKSRYPTCKYGPDQWACEFLDDWGKQIRVRGFDGRHAVAPIRFSTASGHGIGKSTLVAWIIKFIMDTRPFSKGMVTANTGEQLKTKTWAELGKWHKMSLTEHWFHYNASRGNMSLVHKQHDIWRCDAMTCREENSEAFQGLHAANATPFYIFDEASGIPDKIWSARAGGATDGEPMSFDFGNPTRNSGEFFENCVGKNKHRYVVRCIDSRDVAITNKALLDEWVSDKGEDSDWVKVKVRGIFPSKGSIQFIDAADVAEAQSRVPTFDRSLQAVMGVDVARFGDDESVIKCRIGMDAKSIPAKRFQGLDTVQLTGKVIEEIRNLKGMHINVAAIFVDGGGIGGAVVDQLRHLGYNVIEVNFGGSPTDKASYRFKVDEMYGRLREALKTRLALPMRGTDEGNTLFDQLTQREYSYTLSGDKINLESKKLMKERGVGSPDVADALALTFAEDLAIAVMGDQMQQAEAQTAKSDYDPLESNW